MSSVEPRPTFLNLPRKKQDNIFRVALSEFSEKGYQGASINTMVRDLGIAKGSMYQYFKGKDGLFLFVFSRAMETVITHLRSIRDKSRGQALSVRLRMILESGVRFIEDRPDVYTLYVNLLNDRTLPMRETLLKDLSCQGIEYMRDYLEEAVENGELKPGMDTCKAAFLINAVLDRFFLSRTLAHACPSTGIFQGDKQTTSQWIDDIVSMLCRGVLHD